MTINEISRGHDKMIAGVLIILISANPDIELLYVHKTENISKRIKADPGIKKIHT